MNSKGRVLPSDPQRDRCAAVADVHGEDSNDRPAKQSLVDFCRVERKD
jgi:hypothetical protein